MGITVAAIAQASATGGQGGPSNLQRFIAHHPPTFIGGGDRIVANHWFRYVERNLEAMEIISDVMRIRLATFQLEGESYIWWEWIRVSRDPETMTWGEFRELFMGKFFPASARHAKAREFLELKQGNMIMLEYVAKFTELARFKDDYVATYMAKVRRFEDGMKLSIRGKTVGFLLQDMDSMIKTTMAIERERLRMHGVSELWVLVRRGRRISLLLVWERGRRLLLIECFKDGVAAIKAKAKLGLLPNQDK